MKLSLDRLFVVMTLSPCKDRQTRLPELHYPGTESRSLAVWVTHTHSLKSLQAVGGYLD